MRSCDRISATEIDSICHTGTIQAMASRRIDGKKSTDKPKATVEEELPKEEGESVPSNKFANDGSFLEIFKQMQKVRSEEGLNSGSESQKLVAPKLVAETATSSGGPERSVKQQSVRMIQVF